MCEGSIYLWYTIAYSGLTLSFSFKISFNLISSYKPLMLLNGQDSLISVLLTI